LTDTHTTPHICSTNRVAARLLLLGLKALAGLAEEAKEGFGGKLGDSVLPGQSVSQSRGDDRIPVTKHATMPEAIIQDQRTQYPPDTHTHTHIPRTEAGPQVCELALRGLVEAAATDSSSYTPADRAVLLEACAQTITGCVCACDALERFHVAPPLLGERNAGTHRYRTFMHPSIHPYICTYVHTCTQQRRWAAYGGVTWAALVALGAALERALEATGGAEARMIARVAGALEDMAEAVAARAGAGDEEGMGGLDDAMGGGGGGAEQQEAAAAEEEEEARQRDEGLARFIAAYLRLFGLAQGDTEVSDADGKWQRAPQHRALSYAQPHSPNQPNQPITT
jgi:hypothetical protein